MSRAFWARSRASPSVADLTRNPGLTWGIGPEINWTFPNSAGLRARIRAAQAQNQAALANFDNTVLLALKETEQSLATYGAELDHRQALGAAPP